MNLTFKSMCMMNCSFSRDFNDAIKAQTIKDFSIHQQKTFYRRTLFSLHNERQFFVKVEKTKICSHAGSCRDGDPESDLQECYC